MIKRGLLKEFYQKLTSCFSKYYGIHTYHDPEPKIYIKTSLFGKPEIIVAGKDSRLEEISKEEIDKALEKLEVVRRNSEERENRV